MMKIDDILQAALQHAGLNLEDLTEYDNTIVENDVHDDPFSQAVRELETHNKKIDETLSINNTIQNHKQQNDTQISCFNDLNSLINFRNPIKLTTQQSPPQQQQQLQVTQTSNQPKQQQQQKQNSIKIVHLSSVPNRINYTTNKNQQNHLQQQQQQQHQTKIIQMPKILSSSNTRPTIPHQISSTTTTLSRISPTLINDKSVQITKVVSSRISNNSNNSNETSNKQQTYLRSHVYYNPLTSISNASHYLNSNITNNNHYLQTSTTTPLIRVTNNNQENNNGYPKLYYQNARNNGNNNNIYTSNMINYDQLDEEIVVDEEEELGHAETYADYMPSKLKLGIRHPDPVVETSSLASVEPPEVNYNLHIPEYAYGDGALSALQLEAIVYACQKHETYLPNNHRSGFLIGDGAGVGKGRTIAGIIYENYLLKRKRALWLSVSNDLKYDAQRDFNDIGATKISVYSLNKLKYAKISSKTNNKIKKGVIFATYSSLIGESQQVNTKKKYNTRMKQLLQWLGKDFDGIIVFDECHKAKNLVPVGSAKPTKTGLAVLELQEKLPNARIVYASATGASEPKNMAYMVRLGLWGPGTPFSDFNEFIQCIEKRGVGAMEIVAMDMKLRGMYMARQLSFSGTTFKIQEIKLNDEYIKMYDDSVKLWVKLKEKFQEALDLVDKDGKLRKTVWGQFWSSHQRFFKYLCMACKVTHVVDIARNAIHSGKCVVIGLQSTGEARTLEQIDECGEINEFVSTAKGVLQNLIDKHFPSFEIQQQKAQHKLKENANDNKQSFLDILGIGDHIREQINKKQQQQKYESKNSKKVNDILKRLSSYANNIEDNKRQIDNKIKSKSHKTNNNDDSSTSTSSESNSSDENDNCENENYNSDNFDDNSDEYDSDEWTEETIEDDDEQVSLVKNDLNNNYKPNIQPLVVKNENSDDSDSLFSINRSNVTFHPNPNRVIKKKRLVKRRVKRATQSQLLKHETPADSSDDEFKLPTKRIKTEKVALTFDEVKKSKNKNQIIEYLSTCKSELLSIVSQLSKHLPANTLDELIDRLDGPEYVAEMTGRKGRVVCVDEGSYQYETRSETDVPLELMNVVQKERFLSGEKLIAIISEAASSGISLQANRRCENQRRRVHITIELPWSADRAIQQFGRTHRSNQVSAPEYIFLISELAGEKRFASTVAKRLESLGALTHGDRRATESRDLSRFNIDNKYGRQALENVIKSICGIEKPLAKPPQDYKGNFFADARLALVGVGIILQTGEFNFTPDKDYTNINKFLNRLLGCPVHLQNAIFNYFNDVLATVILEAKRTGKWDMGILDLGSNNETVYQKETKYYNLNNDTHAVNRRVELHTVLVERGFSWDKAIELSEGKSDPEGFYLSNQIKNNHRIAILAICAKNTNKSDVKESNITSFCIYRPNTGLQLRQETLETLLKKYKKVTATDAKIHWQEQYFKSVNECTHVYRQGICPNRRNCEIGLRNRKFHILAGSVLTVWTRVENVLSSLTGQTQYRLQIIRIRTSDDKKIVGCVIPNTSLAQVDALLESISSKTYKHQYSIEMNQLISIPTASQNTTHLIQHQISSNNFHINSKNLLIQNKNS